MGVLLLALVTLIPIGKMVTGFDHVGANLRRRSERDQAAIRHRRGDGHVQVLVASLRRIEHLFYAFKLRCELTTAPARILEEWARRQFSQPGEDFVYSALDKNGRSLRTIPYQDLDLNAPWESFDLKHELTDQGIKRFVVDFKSTLAPAA